MPKVDQFVVFRCVRIVRRLLMKNREIGLFCNLSRTTLADTGHVQQLCDFMAANRAIAPSLIFQFTYNDVREMAASEHEKLAVLAELGFRFCLHEMASLRLEPSELALRGFRYVKVPAQLVLNRTGGGVSDARAGELSELLGRFGIDLIVDSIEDENSVIELLDHDVRYGQGSLFSPPRPVRAEALHTLPNMPDDPASGLADATPRSGPVNSAPQTGNQSTAETRGAERSSAAYLSSSAVGLG
jgi:cyclic-di-GMP phosphodiesterase TipF (flagellum assembly factor)